MPHLKQLGSATVPVADQDTAIAFYTEKLGFSLTRTFLSARETAESRCHLLAAAPQSPSSRQTATFRPAG